MNAFAVRPTNSGLDEWDKNDLNYSVSFEEKRLKMSDGKNWPTMNYKQVGSPTTDDVVSTPARCETFDALVKNLILLEAQLKPIS